MRAVFLLHNIGMPPFWLCVLFLVIVLLILGVVIRLITRYGTADGARYAFTYLLLCAASCAFVAYDEGPASQVAGLCLALPLSLLVKGGGGDPAGLIPGLVFCSLANASAFVILFGVYQRARRATASAAA